MDLIDRVIAREGGDKLTDDPADPGGTSKFGISKRSYPDEDIENLTRDRARQLYEQRLMQSNIDKILDPYLREHVFDFSVHSGPEAAVRALQRLLGVTVDGQLGPATLQEVNRRPATYPFYLAYMRERLLFLTRVVVKRPATLKFLTGWISRVLSI